MDTCLSVEFDSCSSESSIATRCWRLRGFTSVPYHTISVNFEPACSFTAILLTKKKVPSMGFHGYLCCCTFKSLRGEMIHQTWYSLDRSARMQCQRLWRDLKNHAMTMCKMQLGQHKKTAAWCSDNKLKVDPIVKECKLVQQSGSHGNLKLQTCQGFWETSAVKEQCRFGLLSFDSQTFGFGSVLIQHWLFDPLGRWHDQNVKRANEIVSGWTHQESSLVSHLSLSPRHLATQ